MSVSSPSSESQAHTPISWGYVSLILLAVAAMWTYLSLTVRAPLVVQPEQVLLAEAYSDVLQEWDCVLADVRDGSPVLYRCADAPENTFVIPGQVREEARLRVRTAAADSTI